MHILEPDFFSGARDAKELSEFPMANGKLLQGG